MLLDLQKGIILERWQAACACRTARKKWRHCLFKPDTMMFKTHKIWFSPEFALHLGSTPAVTRRTLSHRRGPLTKDFFKPFIYACAFATVCFPASCTIRDSLQDKVRVRLAFISPWLMLPSSPTPIFMPHHAHLLSTCPGGFCFICMVRQSLRFPAVVDLVNFSPLVSNKAADSLSIWGCFQVLNKTLGGTPRVCWLNFVIDYSRFCLQYS